MTVAEIMSEVARGALALLVAALAIYLSLKLLGKIAKFIITVILVGLVVYFIFMGTDIVQTVKDAATTVTPSLPF